MLHSHYQKNENEVYLQFIQDITGEATIVTSKIAAPYIEKIFDKLDTNDVNVVATKKRYCLLNYKG